MIEDLDFNNDLHIDRNYLVTPVDNNLRIFFNGDEFSLARLQRMLRFLKNRHPVIYNHYLNDYDLDNFSDLDYSDSGYSSSSSSDEESEEFRWWNNDRNTVGDNRSDNESIDSCSSYGEVPDNGVEQEDWYGGSDYD
jgi:hypothetical protein